MTQSYRMVETGEALRELVAQLADEPRLALDTEFVWERTFYPILGLVQVALEDGRCFLIDTVAVPDLSPLAPVLSDVRIEKILHDAPQDLMILNRAAGVPARRVFDTRTAAGFAGLDSQISLQNLLAETLGVHLPKGHTRTDWTARPLSRHQLDYAADDVVHMPRLATLLRERARASGVEAWLDEEMLALFDGADYAESDPETAFRRIKASAAMAPRHLAVLRELAAWRERTARAIDWPRGFVVADHELVALVRALPADAAALAACRGLHPRLVRRHGTDLLEAIRRGLAVPEAERPAADASPDERQVGRERVQDMLERIKRAATARRIDPRLVASKGEVVRLLAEGATARPEHHRLLRGWRAALLNGTAVTP